MTQLNVRQLLQQRQTMQRDTYYQQRHWEQEAADAQSVVNGTCLGFEADSNRYRVQLAGGRQILAKPITSGAIPRGALVQVSFAKGSSEAFVDEMPS